MMSVNEPSWIVTLIGGRRLEFDVPPLPHLSSDELSMVEWLSVKWRGRQYNLNRKSAIIAVDDGTFIPLGIVPPSCSYLIAKATMSTKIKLNFVPQSTIPKTDSITLGIEWDTGQVLIKIFADGSFETSFKETE